MDMEEIIKNGSDVLFIADSIEELAEKTGIDTDGIEVIPGLFVAGTDANSVCNPDYVIILRGNTLGFAVNSGRMAGRNAVEYIKGIN